MSLFQLFNEALKKRGNESFHPAGKTIFTTGDTVQNVYFVKAGRLKLIRYLADGTPVSLYTASSGQLFAEASLFSENYHCDGIASEPSKTVAFQKKDILAALEDIPEFSFAFMNHLLNPSVTCAVGKN